MYMYQWIGRVRVFFFSSSLDTVLYSVYIQVYSTVQCIYTSVHTVFLLAHCVNVMLTSKQQQNCPIPFLFCPEWVFSLLSCISNKKTAGLINTNCSNIFLNFNEKKTEGFRKLILTGRKVQFAKKSSYRA